MELRSLLLALISTVAAAGLIRHCRRANALDLGLPVVALGVALYLAVAALARLVARRLIGDPAGLLPSVDPGAPQLATATAEEGVRLRRVRRGPGRRPPPG